MSINEAALQVTPLEQLFEEINFQRTKELRQFMKDDSGFVVVQGTTYWTDLFVRHFLFQDEKAIDCDDLLFFVRKKPVKGSSRYLPKYETSVDVFRKDSKKLPIGDPDIDWEETVYLNLIIHQLDYTLTLAICTRTSPKELQVLKRHSQKVYASPSRRKMDTKGEGEEMTYPHICFMVDNFDEVFSDILVKDGEMVCVELVANDRKGSVQSVIFVGSIRYDVLKKVYDARQSSLGTKVAQRMTFGWFAGSGGQRCEFVHMKGPQGKGRAEMAVVRPRGSGVETPTSEPGFCATDMWDSDWDEDPDDFFVYRHQRRLSDPSSNLNNFSRGGWKTKNYESAGSKSRSENEGLDSIANSVSEVEAGDLKDEQESSKERPASPPRCCVSLRTSESCDMSEIYRLDKDCANETPACLLELTPKKEKPKESTPPSPPVLKAKQTTSKQPQKDNVKDIKKKDTKPPVNKSSNIKTKSIIKPKETKPKEPPKPKFPGRVKRIPTQTTPRATPQKTENDKKNTPSNVTTNTKRNIKPPTPTKKSSTPSAVDSKKKLSKPKCNKEEYELAADAALMNDKEKTDTEKTAADSVDDKIGRISDLDPKTLITVNGKEELPCLEDIKTYTYQGNGYVVQETEEVKRVVATETFTPVVQTVETIEINKNETSVKEDCNGNENRNETDDDDKENPAPLGLVKKYVQGFCTLPRGRKPPYNMMKPPKRTTPDGTDIYYWCDITKKGELDDGAYNPLWTMRGFTQTFHFWKESKRQQSTPLNAFVTYVTLPWWSIAKDILDHREGPILTF